MPNKINGGLYFGFIILPESVQFRFCGDVTKGRPIFPGDDLFKYFPGFFSFADVKVPVARTEKLAAYFKDISLSAIYSSNTTRTLHTAFPLAQNKELKITVADACKDTSAIAAFYQELNEKFGSEEAVLLVTHSNLIPYQLLKAGLPKECEDDIGLNSTSGTIWDLRTI